MRPVRNHEISPTHVTPAVLAQFFTLALSRLFVSVLYFCAHAFFDISNRSEMHFVFTFMPVWIQPGRSELSRLNAFRTTGPWSGWQVHSLSKYFRNEARQKTCIGNVSSQNFRFHWNKKKLGFYLDLNRTRWWTNFWLGGCLHEPRLAR